MVRKQGHSECEAASLSGLQFTTRVTLLNSSGSGLCILLLHTAPSLNALHEAIQEAVAGTALEPSPAH